MVSFIVAMNRVNVAAVNTIFALRLSKTGRTVGWTDSRLDGWMGGRTDRWIDGWMGGRILSSCLCGAMSSFVVRYSKASRTNRANWAGRGD